MSNEQLQEPGLLPDDGPFDDFGVAADFQLSSDDVHRLKTLASSADMVELGADKHGLWVMATGAHRCTGVLARFHTDHFDASFSDDLPATAVDQSGYVSVPALAFRGALDAIQMSEVDDTARLMLGESTEIRGETHFSALPVLDRVTAEAPLPQRAFKGERPGEGSIVTMALFELANDVSPKFAEFADRGDRCVVTLADDEGKRTSMPLLDSGTTGEEVLSLFNWDFVSDVLHAIHWRGSDIRVRWGQDLPCLFELETDGVVAVGAVSPRITKGGNDRVRYFRNADWSEVRPNAV